MPRLLSAAAQRECDLLSSSRTDVAAQPAAPMTVQSSMFADDTDADPRQAGDQNSHARSYEQRRCSRRPRGATIAGAALLLIVCMLAILPGLAAAGPQHGTARQAAGLLPGRDQLVERFVGPQSPGGIASVTAAGAGLAGWGRGGSRRSHARRLASRGFDHALAQQATVQTMILQVRLGHPRVALVDDDMCICRTVVF